MVAEMCRACCMRCSTQLQCRVVPGESLAAALLDASMMETDATTCAGVPAESRQQQLPRWDSPQVRCSMAGSPGDDTPVAAQTQMMGASPPTSPASSPSRITVRQEEALLQEASETLAARSAQRRDGDAVSLRAHALLQTSLGGGRGGG